MYSSQHFFSKTYQFSKSPQGIGLSVCKLRFTRLAMAIPRQSNLRSGQVVVEVDHNVLMRSSSSSFYLFICISQVFIQYMFHISLRDGRYDSLCMII